MKKEVVIFFKNDEINDFSNVGNYRVGSYDYSIKGKDGKTYILEFTEFDKYKYRKMAKRGNRPLKTPKKELIAKYVLHLATQYENERGCFANLELEKKINEITRPFTINSILEVVNEISIDTYNEVKFL